MATLILLHIVNLIFLFNLIYGSLKRLGFNYMFCKIKLKIKIIIKRSSYSIETAV